MTCGLTDNIFALIDQSGPFAEAEAVPDLRTFSPSSRAWVKNLVAHAMATRYRGIRNQIFEFLAISDYAEIRALLHDEARLQEIDQRAYGLLGNMFGVQGNAREVVSKVSSYSRTADGVIRYLRNNVLARYSSHIEMTNEIDATSSPVELLLIIFDDRYHRKARFEAKRKLVLMNLAAAIDQRERETDVESKFLKFLRFMNEHVWSPRIRIGELEHSFLLSDHEPADFSCTGVRVISCEEAATIQLEEFQKLTLVKRRCFQANGQEIPVYVSIRKKPPEAKVLKLLRKGEENPAVAVDDELGLMAVFDEGMAIKLFQKHLARSAVKGRSFMTLEDLTDTIARQGSHHGNIGSSARTRMLKFFTRMGGMRVEFIVHTNESYLNYIYQRDVSHDEYEIKRLFDSGVAELLFPRDIYHLDLDDMKADLIRWARKRIEGN